MMSVSSPRRQEVGCVARDDWLVGGDRRTAASERIYAAATDLMARDGLDALDIDTLAARVHCSRATIYRHAGGKAEIRDAVVLRTAAKIIDTVRLTVDGRSGADRVVAAITVALEKIRSDPLGQLMINSLRGAQNMAWITELPIVADLATELNGLAEDDAEAAGWIVRVVLSLLYWPYGDEKVERRILERFVLGAFATRV
jgi:AcrR family transcriptional regulator